MPVTGCRSALDVLSTQAIYYRGRINIQRGCWQIVYYSILYFYLCQGTSEVVSVIKYRPLFHSSGKRSASKRPCLDAEVLVANQPFVSTRGLQLARDFRCDLAEMLSSKLSGRRGRPSFCRHRPTRASARPRR